MGGLCSSDGGRQKSKRNLSVKDVLARTEESDDVVECMLGDAKARYAYVSQRGFYPDDPDKANQDSFAIARHFAGVARDSMFSVFDGHGREGTRCAQFARDSLPLAIGRHFRQGRRLEKGGAGLSDEDVQAASLQAHLDCNRLLRRSKIDDSLSGTTSISVLFHDGRMTICNVGDSRAIVGQRTPVPVPASRRGSGAEEVLSGAPPSLRALALSRDQTPYRADERERVKKSGARIMSLDQIEGLEPIHENWGEVNLGEELDEGGDPPRLWSAHGEYPGTAFTRSFGDAIAEELGVIAEPEMITRELAPVDQIVVIASDGVFEFLTNQSVIDMCAKFDDPLEACRAVVGEAYELWLQYELRTDDITMICIFFDSEGVQEGAVGSTFGASDELSSGVRPARRKIARRDIIGSPTLLDKISDAMPTASPKSEEETARLDSAIGTSVLFSTLPLEQRRKMYDYFVTVHFKPGDCVIKQGTADDHFYVVDKGRFEVRKLPEGLPDTSGPGGDVVYVHDSDNPNSARCIGELGLLHETIRSSSVIAQTDGRLWALPCDAFRKSLKSLSAQSPERNVTRALRDVEALRPLYFYLIQKLADIMTEVVEVEDGKIIAAQGAKADMFYLLVEGKCEAVVKDLKGRVKQRRTLSLTHFGEEALFPNRFYDASLTSLQDCKYVCVSRSQFEGAVGKLQDLTAKDAEHRRRLVAIEDADDQPLLQELELHGCVQSDSTSMTVLCKADKHVYTLKAISKAAAADADVRDSVVEEARILKALSKISFVTMCPCVPKLKATYSDRDSLYVLFEETMACTVAQVIADPVVSVTEVLAKHLAICCIVGLEAIHYQGIVYRGINADSVFVSHDGCVILSDFQHAKENAEIDNYTLCGAMDYFSPEALAQVGHGQPADFWSLGVLLFEFLTGTCPFAAENEIDIYAKIMQYEEGTLNYPDHISPFCRDFIDGLLTPSPDDRLGGSGPDNLKGHPWVAEENWNSLDNPAFSSIIKPHLTRALISDDATSNFSKKYSGDRKWFSNF